jgi:hypothetical protein
MKILVDEPNRAKKPRYFLGNTTRLATMTSVRFIDDSTLVACHLVGEKMLAYKFDAKEESYRVICSIPTCYNSMPTITDLLDYDGKRFLVASNFDGRSGSLYSFENGRLAFEKDLVLPENTGNCHAARFLGAATICLGTNTNELFFLDCPAGSIISRLQLPFHPKDFCFLPDNLMMVLFAIRSPSKSAKPVFASGLQLLRLEAGLKGYTVLRTHYFKPAAFDAIIQDQETGIFYFTDQHSDRVILARLNGIKIDVMGELRGFDFPHGVDVNEHYLAVTNYGDSSIDFIEKSQMHVLPINGYSGRLRPYTASELEQSVILGLKKVPGLLAFKRWLFS